jgi:16S rRNA processing protein RimM
MPEYFKIGKFAAAHGVQGQLILQHQLGKKTSLAGLQTIFVEENKNSFLPWFIQSARIKSNTEVYIALEGITTREEATRIVQKVAWLAEKDFKKFAAKSAPANLLGYDVVDNTNVLGPILEVIEQPHQLLCRLELHQKEVLIPLNDAFLQKIDHRKKQVLVTLPEGLLDIYLA